MAVESASYISQLNTSNPAASDNISEGDDHLRLKNCFANSVS